MDAATTYFEVQVQISCIYDLHKMLYVWIESANYNALQVVELSNAINLPRINVLSISRNDVKLEHSSFLLRLRQHERSSKAAHRIHLTSSPFNLVQIPMHIPRIPQEISWLRRSYLLLSNLVHSHNFQDLYNFNTAGRLVMIPTQFASLQVA